MTLMAKDSDSSTQRSRHSGYPPLFGTIECPRQGVLVAGDTRTPHAGAQFHVHLPHEPKQQEQCMCTTGCLSHACTLAVQPHGCIRTQATQVLRC